MYAICINDYDELGNSALAYWVTRCGDTDNYSYDTADAARFATRSAAKCLSDAIGLDEDHHVIEI